MNKNQLKKIIKEVIAEVYNTSHRFIFDVPDDEWARVILPSIAKNTTYKGLRDIQVSQEPKSVTVGSINTRKIVESVLQGLGLERTADQIDKSLWKKQV